MWVELCEGVPGGSSDTVVRGACDSGEGVVRGACDPGEGVVWGACDPGEDECLANEVKFTLDGMGRGMV